MAASLLFEYLTTGNVVASFAILAIATLVINALSAPTYPSFAWVGEGQGLWPWIKGNITFILHYHEWVKDGYKKVFLCCTPASARSLTITIAVREKWQAVHHSWHCAPPFADHPPTFSGALDARTTR